MNDELARLLYAPYGIKIPVYENAQWNVLSSTVSNHILELCHNKHEIQYINKNL